MDDESMDEQDKTATVLSATSQHDSDEQDIHRKRGRSSEEYDDSRAKISRLSSQ